MLQPNLFQLFQPIGGVGAKSPSGGWGTPAAVGNRVSAATATGVMPPNATMSVDRPKTKARLRAVTCMHLLTLRGDAACGPRRELPRRCQPGPADGWVVVAAGQARGAAGRTRQAPRQSRNPLRLRLQWLDLRTTPRRSAHVPDVTDDRLQVRRQPSRRGATVLHTHATLLFEKVGIGSVAGSKLPTIKRNPTAGVNTLAQLFGSRVWTRCVGGSAEPATTRCGSCQTRWACCISMQFSALERTPLLATRSRHPPPRERESLGAVELPAGRAGHDSVDAMTDLVVDEPAPSTVVLGVPPIEDGPCRDPMVTWEPV